ncbi:MAG: hypothetical protein GXO65_03330 [Euryarchaeota archaeon]|nr:hypothetical protein [Euryarchaeota archaeon]
MEEKARCPECGFVGEFPHRWSEGDFLLLCPSCGAVTHRVRKDDIDAMAASVMEGIKGALPDNIYNKRP